MKQILVALLLVSACADDSSDNNGPICGDNVVEGAEQCDDGNTVGGDGCSATCTREPRCGDNVVDTTEQCDDGNVMGGDGCSAACTLECGNGVMDGTEQCDDGNTMGGDGCSATCTTEQPLAITAQWLLKNVAGTTQSCPQGYNTLAVHSQQVDSNGANLGSPIIDLFDCSTGSGTTGPLYPAHYKVYFAIMTSNGSMTYATTPSELIVLDSNKTMSATIYTDGGYFAWAWKLIGAVSNNMLTCAQANSGGVELVSTISSSTNSLSDIFTCEDGSGLTAVLPVGMYTVSADVLNMNDQSIGTAPALTNKQIMAPNKVTDLGTVMIPVDGK